jgi:26S proteasome regulatory subunit N13
MMHHETVRGSPTKLRVAPDHRKGTLSVQRDPDGTVHVTWRDRSSGAVGLDRTVFPADVTFQRIKTGKESDRVYEMRYGATDSRFFFWMQVSVCASERE